MKDLNTKPIETFRDLIVWQKGMDLVKEIYKATSSFPKEELYGLSSQMRKAAISVPSNIAEGFRRRFDKEQKQFLNITLGSCAELETQLTISKALNYIDVNTEKNLLELLDHICRMIVTIQRRI